MFLQHSGLELCITPYVSNNFFLTYNYNNDNNNNNLSFV